MIPALTKQEHDRLMEGRSRPITQQPVGPRPRTTETPVAALAVIRLRVPATKKATP